MEKSKQLSEESVGKLLLKFSIPAIVGMLVNGLYNIVDRIFVGRGVGSLAISGIAITFPISNIIMGFGMLVGIGAAAIASIRLGQHKNEQAEKILGNAFVLLLIVSFIVTFLGLVFLDPILAALGTSAEIMPYAKQYITIILIGVVLQNIGFGLNNLIRSEGNPKIAMVTMLIGAILNTIFNPIFIFGLGLGVRGSALATIVSQTVCSIWTISHFTKSKKSILKLKVCNMKLEKYIVKDIFSIGMSPFIMQLAASAVTILLNKSLAQYGGDLAIGAMALITSVTMLILMPIFGINQGAQPIIGFNYGAKQYDRVKRALKLAVIGATAISTVGFLVVEAIPHTIISVFNNKDIALINMGAHGMVIYLCMLPVIGFQIVSTNFFQAIGKAKKSIFLSLLRQVILLIPLILILPNIMGLKLDGIWIAGPTSDFLSTVVTLIILIKELRKLKQPKENLKSESSIHESIATNL